MAFTRPPALGLATYGMRLFHSPKVQETASVVASTGLGIVAQVYLNKRNESSASSTPNNNKQEAEIMKLSFGK